MPYTRSELKELGLNQLSETQLDRALEAFNGLCQDFGRPWLEAYYKGALSPHLVMAIVNLWEDWSLVNRLPGWEQLAKRWQSGIDEQGVKTEVRVVAALLSKGARVELFPPAGNRVPDFRYQVSDAWIYAEVSKRELSKAVESGRLMLNQVADAAAEAVPGRHGKVGVLRELTQDDLNRFIGWLRALGAEERRDFEDIAVFDTDTLESGTNREDIVFQLVGSPKLFSTKISFREAGVSLKGSACAQISDTAAQEVLEKEAAQLPREGPGIVCLDVSTIVGGIDEWVPLIQRRFQPSINTRISAVVLFSTFISSGGLSTTWRLLSNPHARTPIPPPELGAIQKVCTS